MSQAASKPKTTVQASPWRKIFEDIRRSVGNKRDDTGVLGSINWLRKQMEQKGANPNVVRNIIYRDKGKINDKRILFEILNQLWVELGHEQLQVPELEVLLSTGGSAEQEVMQLLGREKRRAYRSFVGAVRSSYPPKLLITGRPGAGKTLLTDYIQQALEMPPRAAEKILRLEFSRNDLAASLSRLSNAIGVNDELFESRLVKIASSTAFSVQADAQADVARAIIEELRYNEEPLVLLLHISQVVGSSDQEDTLGLAPLRLNTADVPRVNSTEWLWVSLLTPLSRLPNISILVSMVDTPSRVVSSLGRFKDPIKLSPPTASEARRFVKARLPHLATAQQEALVNRAKRSFEDLRTLTLLAEIREPLSRSDEDVGLKLVSQLSHLVHTAGDVKLRNFLGALATLSLQDYPSFTTDALNHVRESEEAFNSITQAFLDVVPGEVDTWRCFSRALAKNLREELLLSDPTFYRSLNARASENYEVEAAADPRSEIGTRYVYHLIEARLWEQLEQWLRLHSVQQSLLRKVWRLASQELRNNPKDTEIFEAITLQVAAYYVKLGSHNHPDVVEALGVLAESQQPELRAWSQLKRAESEVIKANYDMAEKLVENWPDIDDPTLNAEVTLVKASVARWRSQLDVAAELIEQGARQKLENISPKSVSGELVHAKVSVWAGLIAKDRGELHEALEHFNNVQADDDLIRARVAFQQGDALAKLGKYDAALKSLEKALKLSKRSEAPLHEQIRYQSRLAHLLRKRGSLSEASNHFAEAMKELENQDTLGIVRDFEWAKLRDERALNLLATGQFDAAIFDLWKNIEVFQKYQSIYEVDATFRILRTTLRLSFAYWCRSLGQRLTKPFMKALNSQVDHPDVLHARQLCLTVQESLDQKDQYHFGTIYRSYLLMSSLVASSTEEAIEFAIKASDNAVYDYDIALSASYLSLAYLRNQSFVEVLDSASKGLAAIDRLQNDSKTKRELSDEGLNAWLLGLKMQAYAIDGNKNQAIECLITVLSKTSLAIYHESVLRAFAEIAEQDIVGWLTPKLCEHMNISVDDILQNSYVRLADALVVQWQQK